MGLLHLLLLLKIKWFIEKCGTLTLLPLSLKIMTNRKLKILDLSLPFQRFWFSKQGEYWNARPQETHTCKMKWGGGHLKQVIDKLCNNDFRSCKMTR